MSRTKITVLILITFITTLACATLMGKPSSAPTAQPIAKTKSAATEAGSTKPDTTVLQPADKGLTLGKPDAPVKIEVFEDFQCPGCRSYSQDIEPRVLKELVDTGKAFYVFRFYPFLDGGDPKGESHQAASASLCASEQGKFWEYKSILFDNWAGENAGGYSDKNLISFAEETNLNMDAFNKCFTENRYQNLIDADLRDAKSMGIQGTPSVFVNGTLLTPGYIPSFEDIKAAVEAQQP
jgi:protein-disulfide isomerase